MNEKKKNVSAPRILPIVTFMGEQYFADLRLNEFRPIQEFMSIPFDREDGKTMCNNAGVIVCRNCGMSVIISKAYENEPLRCMKCFGRLDAKMSG